MLHELRVPLGYWVAKDTADDLHREVEEFRKAVAQFNVDMLAILALGEQ